MEVLTDISTDVEEAFEEMECSVHPDWGPHGGDKAAYLCLHSCAEGFICRSHYDQYVKEVYPYNQRIFDCKGYMWCDLCDKTFPTPDAFQKAYPL